MFSTGTWLQQQAQTTERIQFPRQVSKLNVGSLVTEGDREALGNRCNCVLSCLAAASSDTCACCIMLVCTHLLGSCHQQRQDKEICCSAECARTALIASYALATDFEYAHSLTLNFGSIQLTLSLPPSPTPWWVLALITDARAHCDTCEQCVCSRSLVYALSYVVCLLALFAHLRFPAFCINPLEHLEVHH